MNKHYVIPILSFILASNSYNACKYYYLLYYPYILYGIWLVQGISIRINRIRLKTETCIFYKTE